MPYGPGKFEGEPASTFLLYQCTLDGGADETSGPYDKIEGQLMPGLINVEAARIAGYTDTEILDSCVDLGEMSGAILCENDQGFVHATIYNSDNEEGLNLAWISILEDAEGAAE